jgi:hypothetical protein
MTQLEEASMTDDSKAPAPSEKVAGRRSPSYPAVGLPAALDMARKIYEKEKRAAVPPHVAAEHLGYAGLSGPSRRALTTLKLYGLFVEESGKLRVTDQGVRILEAPKDHSDREKLLRDAAQRPAIFREIMAKYGDSIPTDRALRYALITEWGFLDSAADGVIKAFRETETLAKPQLKEQNTGMVGADTTHMSPPPPPAKHNAPWLATYPVGRGEFMTVGKDSPPSLHELRMLIKGLQHHLSIEAESEKEGPPEITQPAATGVPHDPE